MTNLVPYRFKQKFKSFIDQYELRELHFLSIMRTKETEVQYNLARYEQARKIAESEAARSRTLTAQVSTFSQTETELRSQLNIYVEKFKQVRAPLFLLCCTSTCYREAAVACALVISFRSILSTVN